MATDGAALTRLGGGRWQTKDGRFAIEPQGGSWVVVDAEQTDELGLSLVRGPFASLGAAREAIEVARAGEAPASPLAARIEEARDRPPPARTTAGRSVVRRGPAPRANARAATRTEPPEGPRQTVPLKPRAKAVAPPVTPSPPPPPPEPAWLGTLAPARRRASRDLIKRLVGLGLEDPESVARAETVDGEPAVARMAIERRVAAILAAHPDGAPAVSALLELISAGHDATLGVRWRLVDGEGRPIDRPRTTGDGS